MTEKDANSTLPFTPSGVFQPIQTLEGPAGGPRENGTSLDGPAGGPRQNGTALDGSAVGPQQNGAALDGSAGVLRQNGMANGHGENQPACIPPTQPVEILYKDGRKRFSIVESLKSSNPSMASRGTGTNSVISQAKDAGQNPSIRRRLSKKHPSLTGGQLLPGEAGMAVTSLPSNDSFHQPTVMVISPHNPVVLQTQQTHASPHTSPRTSAQTSPHASLSKLTGRFSVSPVQYLVDQHKGMMNGDVKTRTISEKSSTGFSNRVSQASPEPHVQFQVSDLGFDHDEDAHQHLLGHDQEVVDLLNKDSNFKGTPEEKAEEAALFHIADLDEMGEEIYEVDENQKTVQSFFSVNTQDSDRFHHAPLICGNISFTKESADMPEQKKHYVSVSSETDMDTVAHFLRQYWGLKSPKIVLSVISNTDNYKPWKNQRLRDDFQKGIIKAANATTMWIITNGIDGGITKTIGDAVREFNTEIEDMNLLNQSEMSDVRHKKRKLPIIGITPKDMVVPLTSYMHGNEGVQIQIDGGVVHRDFYEFNPDHSHFIIVDDEDKELPQDSMRCRLEQQFRVKHETAKAKRLMSIASASNYGDFVMNENLQNTIPVVGMLVQGTPNNIDHILFYLTNKMPVLILKGSGGLADMLAYAFEELHEKGDADPDFETNFLKPELIKMINRMYPTYFKDPELERVMLRDKIIQSVKLANEVVDGDHCYMTVVDTKGWGSSLKDLDKYILRALFRIENTEALGLREQLQNDLQLTVDWNRPDLAWEIFQHDFVKVRIDKKMFEQSIVKKDREGFIDLFLTQGVRVHSYLTMKKLGYLFERAEDRENMFVSICLESILGISVSQVHPLGDDFLPDNLNRLMYKLSKLPHFFQPYSWYENADGTYSKDPILAERKAIIYLIIWAVLMNRQKLAKTLWNRCDEPIGVALVCSRMYKELSKYTTEQYLRIELEKNAKEFGEMALGALAICWRDSSLQAYIMLGKRLPDFNNKTVIEIAHDAGYIHFLAHPCCQKWLTKTFLGRMHIKELDWGLFRLPYWFKILASVFFIFPMYIWITFIPAKKKKPIENLVSDEEENFNGADDSDQSDDDENEMGSKPGLDPLWLKPKTAVRGKLKKAFFSRKQSDVSFFDKIYLLWTAPITKFWNTQVLYFTFLGLFCLATLWPVCGNQYLDVVLWCWTFVIELELICRVYIKYHKYKTLSLVGNCVDIFMIFVFLLLLLFTRILHVWVSFNNYMTAKAFLCLYLIYFFYRLVGVYLPISPTLGPMLLRINRMISHDFVAFIRMFLIFMIAGGVAIQAVIYPNWPFNTLMFVRIITRPMYAMFLTQVQDLEGDDNCMNRYQDASGYCSAEPGLFDSGTGVPPNSTLLSGLEKCPYSSASGYVITLQYIFICKLILVTLLFAMFSLTISKVDKEASELWKFQRYALIADFIERFTLPPPLTVFSFIYLFFIFVYQTIKSCGGAYNNWRQGMDKYKTTPKFIVGKGEIAQQQFVPYIRENPLTYFLYENINACGGAYNNWQQGMDKYKAKPVKPRSRKVVNDTQFWKRVAREYVASEQARLEREKMGGLLQTTCEIIAKPVKPRSRKVVNDTQFWKRVAREYVSSEQARLEREKMGAKQGDMLVSIQDNMQSHRKQTKRLSDKVVELEKVIQSSRLYLESIQHKLEKTDVMGITNVKGNFIHVAARQSPYPGSTIARFPVFDKYVPLEVVYDVYDPKTYTLEKSRFPEAEILDVDEDIIELNRKREERLVMAEDDVKRLSPLPVFHPKWNSVITYTEDGERREIDRRSWINIDNQPLRYTLDALDIPQNPLGRTGIRGKGNLWRWGPNHVIKAVITRWRRKHNPAVNATPQFLYVEGKRLLEFISVQKETSMESSFGLPGDVMLGYNSPYSIICKSFMLSVMDNPELAQKIEKFDQAEMIQFFSKFSATFEEENYSRSSSPVSAVGFPGLVTYSSSSTLTSLTSKSKTNVHVEDQQGFSASLLYKGYLDDQRNTDNAWVEAEVWNFHYDLGDSFDLNVKEESSVKWKEVSPYVKMFGNESVIVQEAARIHDAYH